MTSWDRARRLLQLRLDQGAEDGARAAATRTPRPGDAFALRPAPSICIVSGKGGTGKTMTSAALAQLFARRGRTLLLDADLGVANAHILQDVTPEHTLVDVVEGRMCVRDVVVRARPDLDLLGGGSGFSRMAGLSTVELHLIASGLEELEREYDFLLVDSAAGLSNQTLAIAAACDVVVLVTTPDLTAMTDAYAFLKVFLRRKPASDPLLVVNRASGEAEARQCSERIRDVAKKFLGRTPRAFAVLPEDRAAFRSQQRRTTVVDSEPDAPLARALERMAQDLERETLRLEPAGLGRGLLRTVAYTPKVV